MMSYTDVFGNNTLPPADYSYSSYNLTSNASFVWSYNSVDTSSTIAKIMDVACSTGVIFTLPDATEVSTGEDFLIRNVGSNTLTVKNPSGAQVAQVLSGAATYFYLTDNSSSNGTYGTIAFGVGTSSVDATSLVGYGIKAIGHSLNQSHPVETTNTGVTVDADYRAKLIAFTGGADTFNLDSAAVLGDDFFFLFKNSGTGTATLDPASSELIDGMSSMQIQPGESLLVVSTGVQWYTVGYGRSTLYQFTQLTKDLTAGGTFTLTASEASNKLLTFVGSPSAAVTVVVPAVVSVYYTQNNLSTAHSITLKTAAGAGALITQGARVIALCDGTDIVSAQSATVSSSVSLLDGASTTPSLYFSSQTNTGLYKAGTQDLGITVNGVLIARFGSSGTQVTTIGPNSTQRHTVPAVSSDTLTLNAATQNLSNKTLVDPIITLSSTQGAAGEIPVSQGAGLPPVWGTIQGGINYTKSTSDVTASNKSGIIADTSGGSFIVTLPGTPSVWYQVSIVDGSQWGINPLTVARNGSTIEGVAQDLTLDISGASVHLIYDGTTWEVFAQVGGAGGTAVNDSSPQTLTNKTLGSGTVFTSSALAQIQATALSF